MNDAIRVNEPSDDWPETYVFSVDSTSEWDGPIEAVGATYRDAAMMARAALLIRCSAILEKSREVQHEVDKLIARANAVMKRGKEIESRWLDTELPPTSD